ncbi:MAG: PKD domain-containing protein [Thermoguttaceae bacterium]|nr:PKD domain-containing protein [Thermoguttaceae bacterium]
MLGIIVAVFVIVVPIPLLGIAAKVFGFVFDVFDGLFEAGLSCIVPVFLTILGVALGWKILSFTGRLWTNVFGKFAKVYLAAISAIFVFYVSRCFKMNVFRYVLILCLFFGGVLHASAQETSLTERYLAAMKGEMSAKDTAYYFLVDISPSMRGPMPGSSRTRIDEVKVQLLKFFDSLATTDPNARVRVFVFTTTVEEIKATSLRDESSLDDLKNVCREIVAKPNRSASTYVWSSLKYVYERAQEELEEDRTLANVRIVAYSDGEDNQGNAAPIQFFDNAKDKTQQWKNIKPVYVSIGESTPQIIRDLEKRGWITTMGTSPELLVPPNPILAINPNPVKEGEKVWIVSRSSGAIEKTVIEVDGNRYEQEELEISFDEPNLHRVNIRVVGKDGNAYSKEYNVLVTEKKLVADFEVKPSQVSVGQNVTFIDKSSGEPARWNWEFSDGTTGVGKVCVKAFNKPGKYSATLTVRDSRGKESTKKFPNVAEVVADSEQTKAMFVAEPEKTVVGKSVLLADVSTGKIDLRRWTIDGKVGGSEKTTNATFDAAGKHTVKLQVKDVYGKTDAAEQTIVVEEIPEPVADFALPTRTIRVHEPFVLYYTGQGGEVSEFHWFVDDDEVSKSSVPTEIRIDEAGLHKIELTVKGPGGENSETKEIDVAQIEKPTPGFTITPNPVDVDSPTTISDRSRNSDNTRYFVDGKPLEDYVVLENASEGVQAPETVPGEDADAENSLDEIEPELSVDAEGEVSVDEDSAIDYPDLKKEPETKPVQPLVAVIDEDDPDSPTLVFKEPGEYLVKQVCENEGGTEECEKTVVVKPYAPPIVRLVAPSEAEGNVPVKVVVMISGDVQNGTIDFGDGPAPLDFSASSQVASRNVALDVEHVFSTSGEYEVACVVEGRGGSSEPTSAKIKVGGPPVAEFTVESDKNWGEVRLSFTNNSQGSGPFTFEITKNGEPYETIALEDRSRFERTVKGPGVFRILLTAEGGTRYPPDRAEQTIKIKAHSIWFTVCLIGLGVLILAVAGASVWYVMNERVYALRGWLEYCPRNSEEPKWRDVRINNWISKKASVFIGNEDVGGIVFVFGEENDDVKKEEDKKKETIDKKARGKNDAEKTKITISKTCRNGEVRYLITLNDGQDSVRFTREKYPTRNEPLILGDWKLTFSD